jgi:hypothetical protein
MSTSLQPLLTQFKSNVKFQQTPIPYFDEDYTSLLIQGIKRLYIDEGNDDNFLTEYDEDLEQINRNLSLTEQEYIIIASEIALKNQVKLDYQTIVSYSTDSLSITKADAPYRNISEEIKELESRLSQLAWKFSHRQV